MAIPTVRDRKSAPEAYFKIPDSLKLSEREPSLVGTVPGLTDEMEAKCRGGYGAFSLGLHTKTISVGYLGSMRNVTPKDPEYLQAAKETEVFDAWGLVNGRIELGEMEVVKGCYRGIDLKSESEGVYQHALDILEVLPEKYFELVCSRLKLIDLSGYSSESISRIRGGQYLAEKNLIEIPDDRILGSKRNITGFLLHELGHPLEDSLKKETKHIDDAHTILRDTNRFLGTDFGFIEARSLDRKIYQGHAWEEFFAETFMHYVVQAERLRGHIESLPVKERRAFRTIYDIIMDCMGGRQYT